jgi:sodium transport system permease protein
MLNPSQSVALAVPLVVARKEMVDALRDVRSVIASLFYALMGPLVVGLVSVAVHPQPEAGALVLGGMMSVFTLVAAFVGGMNVAMDAVAGERERRSLLPLLLNPVRRLDIVLGKWLAVGLFSIAGLALNLLGFAVVLGRSGMHVNVAWPRAVLVIAIGVFPLPLLAASTQLLISTICRGVKEAQTYLSLIVFLPMGIGMFVVFSPVAERPWWGMLPLVGQQLQLQRLVNSGEFHMLQPIVLGCLTVAMAILVLLVAANRLQRDEIVYGN